MCFFSVFVREMKFHDNDPLLLHASHKSIYNHVSLLSEWFYCPQHPEGLNITWAYLFDPFTLTLLSPMISDLVGVMSGSA